MCDEQKSWAEIAATFQISGKLARKLAAHLGLEKRATWDKNINPQKLRELCESGDSWEIIGAKFGVSTTCVQTNAKKFGIKKRKKEVNLPLDQFKETLTWGWSWDRIAKYFDVGHTTVHRLAKKLGLTKAPVVHKNGTVFVSERFKDWFDDINNHDDVE